MATPPPERRRRRLLTAGTFVLAAAVAALWLLPLHYHWDGDSYYHLAVARSYAHGGVFHDLEWARFSAMAKGFGDKDLLFHLLLAPFAALPDASAGGQLALALLCGLLAALLADLGMRAAGPWGCLLPWLLVLTSGDFDLRLLRLRPELLALALLLLTLAALGSARYRTAGALAALFTLSYTAFHALLGVCGLLFLVQGWVRRRWEPLLIAYPALGVGLALLVHPHFPANLKIWWLQSLDYFRLKDVLDVGVEIRPEPTDEVLLKNLGWWLLPVVAWRSTVAAPPREDAAGPRDAFVVAALAFGVLSALMLRFSLYFIPFASLALLFAFAAGGRRLGAWTRLPGRGRVPLALGLVVAIAASAPQIYAIATALSDPARYPREADLADFGRSVPPGAKVAATWGEAEAYVFFAPQGRYLNLLDPVFMAVPYPEAYRLQRRIFAGIEPDVPLAAAAGLDSDYLAVSEVDPARPLLQRLLADPRASVLHKGPHWLFQFRPDPGGSLWLDWRLAPAETGGPSAGGPSAAGEAGAAYPRLGDPRLRAREGYVDLHRLGSPLRCRTFLHTWSLEAPSALLFELAPYGPASLAVDGEVRAVAEDGQRAILGHGVLVPLSLPAGEHRLAVQACPSSQAPGYGGFFLRLRSEKAATSGS
jgi:hypothetical protein